MSSYSYQNFMWLAVTYLCVCVYIYIYIYIHIYIFFSSKVEFSLKCAVALSLTPGFLADLKFFSAE